VITHSSNTSLQGKLAADSNWLSLVADLGMTSGLCFEHKSFNSACCEGVVIFLVHLYCNHSLPFFKFNMGCSLTDLS